MADARFNSAYSAVINQKLEDERLILANGNATDWADYRERVGLMRGLETAIEICEETYLKNMGVR